MRVSWLYLIFYYMYNLCIFLTTDQKVTGLNPVGVTKKKRRECALFFFL